jgi:FkbM family methyltransferase
MITKKIKYRYRSLRYRYLLDPQEIKFIVKNTSEGDTCVDIGSHKGGYLYWLRKKVGKQGKVYAFEPQIKLYKYLQEIVKINNYNNVILEKRGLSDHVGKTEFYIPKSKNGTSPGARIDMLGNSNHYEKVTIDLQTLDQYFLLNKIYPDLIKIDVEGHEKKVLLGGLELLKTCMPKILLECEYRHLMEGEDIVDVFNILTRIGYKGYFYTGSKINPISDFRREVHQRTEKGNFWDKKGYINNFIFVASNLEI